MREFLMNSWPTIEPILGSFFLIGGLTLPVLIFYLAVEKKKLSEYSKDLIKYGKIKKIYCNWYRSRN